MILSRIGEYERSVRLYEDLVKEYPANPKVWLSYGHVLKTEGRQDECVAAYRRSISLDPTFGEAYWSLANLKTFRFDTDDFAAMRTGVENPSVSEENRVHFCFALGKALEDTADYAASFEHYAKGNALHRARHPYDANKNTARIRHLQGVCTHEFFATRAGSGCPAANPIFIVGMPRSGSTLLEQILSSHSAIEGTTELPEMITLARELRALADSDEAGSYADVLATMPADALRELGERYLERTRVHRKTSRPHFIDKMPNNYLHVAMIQLALPNAKIIDARRHPMACCFSNFKQHYARGQNFSYDLDGHGPVLPRLRRPHGPFRRGPAGPDPPRFLRADGRRHRGRGPPPAGLLRTALRTGVPAFLRERTSRPDGELRAGPPADLSATAIDPWRHYEQWLEPLRTALGPALSGYPARRPGLTCSCCVRATPERPVFRCYGFSVVFVTTDPPLENGNAGCPSEASANSCCAYTCRIRRPAGARQSRG